MRPTLRKAGLALMALLGSSSIALAAVDPTAGKSVFASHCVVCHSIQSGVNKIGPSLAGIVDSKGVTVPGFNFSPTLKNVDITWDDAKFDKFLVHPVGFVQGTKMFVDLPSETDRQNVIAYLNTLKK